MIAARFHSVDKGVKVEEVEVPSIKKPNEVLLEVKKAGICGSDSAILEGRHPASPPVILGHEYVGEVVEIGGDVETLNPDDKVVIDPNIKCGKCHHCRNGRENLCENMTTLGIFIDGGFASYNVAPESAVYKIPDNMRWNDAVLVEPVSCVLNGLGRAEIGVGNVVAIIGAGPMGLLWTALAKSRGAGCVIVSDIIENRLKLADKLGADVTVRADEEELPERIKGEIGRLADVAVEVVGKAETVETAMKSIGDGGKVVIFGTVGEDEQVAIRPYDITRHEKEIIGSYIANYTINPAIETLHRGLIDSDTIITDEFSVGEFHEAMRRHRSGEAIKVILHPQE